jgi:CBS domain-containing protein/mannitol/fructose-specific phosphotransferase system IIA component (Ntr-type)
VKLATILRPEHVVIPMAGGSVSEAARVLLERVNFQDGMVDAERIRERLENVSSEDLVALPDRAFIVHMRTDAVHNVLLLAGASAETICRELGDTDAQCAPLIFLLLAPPRRAAEYLQLISALGRFLSRYALAEELLACTDAAAIARYLESVEFEMAPQLRVRDIMNTRPRTTSAETTLREAAREMVKSGLGALIAVDGEAHVVGMLGEKELMRDLLTNYLQGDTAQRDAPASTGRRKVRDVMTRQVLGVSPDQPLSEVASIMVNKDVERVPVVEDGKLAGVLTRADIVRKLIGY